MKRLTVKAREHHGSESLDLTVPAKVREKYGIQAGDVFEIEIHEKGGQLTMIAYRRMKAV